MTKQTPQQQLWRQVMEGIETFVDTWQRSSKKLLTPVQIANLYSLLAVWRQDSDYPQGIKQYGLRLGPLFCSNADEQVLFHCYWLAFWRSQHENKLIPSTTKSGLTSAEFLEIQEPGSANWYDKFNHILNKRHKLAKRFFILTLVITVVVLFLKLFPAADDKAVELKPIATTKDQQPKKPLDKIKPQVSNKPFLKSIPKRQPPPSPLFGVKQREQLDRATYYVAGAALIMLFLWMALKWWARRVMFQNLDASARANEQLHYKVAVQDIDTELLPEFNNALARLRFAKSGQRRIDWPNSLKAIARQGGFPELRYRFRQRQVDYVVISDSRHLCDQAAWLMKRLANTLNSAHIRVQYYDFDQNPDWVWPKGQRTLKPLPLDQVLMRNAGSRLLFAVNHDVLFYRLSGGIQHWLKDLHSWPNYQLLLLTRPESFQYEHLLDKGYSFRILDQQTDLNTLLDFAKHSQYSTDAKISGFNPDWLNDSSPEPLSDALQWLENTNGNDGLRFLGVLALYPKLHGDLTFALFQWFNQPGYLQPLQPATFLKTVTLPWCRQGWLPQWLRQALLRKLSPEDYHQASLFYQQLFAAETTLGGKTLELDIQKPASFWRLEWIRSAIHRARFDSPLRDQIFAKILLSPRSRFSQLLIPHRFLQALPREAVSRWLPLLLLTLKAGGFLAAILAGWYFLGMDRYGQHLLRQKQADYAQITVAIHYHADAKPLAQVIGSGLDVVGFKIAWKQDNSITANNINAPASLLSELSKLSEYMSWGMKFQNNDKAETPSITLAQMPQTGQLFRDQKLPLPYLEGRYSEPLPWMEAENKDVVATPDPPKTIIVDPKIKPILPVMKKIPAGRFKMGSPEDEPGPLNSEGPVHQVSIAAFAMAATELTFAEWDVCVKAGACREVYDQGWGRETRPVINVSWQDAQTYINWLNQTQGLSGAGAYRLPTESEWEYAARAGTQSAYFWGEQSQCDYANGADISLQKEDKNPGAGRYTECSDGFDYTAPVGSFKPNAWGLYDMSGNVWEWVSDCWHDSYKGAPADGSAWLDEGNDACMRLVRGGSWNSVPQFVRSAYRDWSTPDYRIINIGFRLARTL